jgi:ATP-dependent Clp protease ATP-binding subunit ClpC
MTMPEKRMERLTQRARHVLAFAQEDAVNLHHDSIGTEHILLGLLREEGGSAARVLRDVGVDYPALRSLVKDVNPAMANTRLELSAHVKMLLERAVIEARRRGQGFIGTEHLLMAITGLPGSKAYTLLKRLNVDIEGVYQRASDLVFGPDAPAFAACAAIATIGFLCLAE